MFYVVLLLYSYTSYYTFYASFFCSMFLLIFVGVVFLISVYFQFSKIHIKKHFKCIPINGMVYKHFFNNTRYDFSSRFKNNSFSIKFLKGKNHTMKKVKLNILLKSKNFVCLQLHVFTKVEVRLSFPFFQQ